MAVAACKLRASNDWFRRGREYKSCAGVSSYDLQTISRLVRFTQRKNGLSAEDPPVHYKREKTMKESRNALPTRLEAGGVCFQAPGSHRVNGPDRILLLGRLPVSVYRIGEGANARGVGADVAAADP